MRLCPLLTTVRSERRISRGARRKKPSIGEATVKIFELKALRKKWVPALGWGIFIALIIALEAGHYIFNPFVFGFAYYTIYVLSRLGAKEERVNADLLAVRLIGLGLIALLSLWAVLNNEVNKHAFLRQFDKTCAKYAENPSASQVCGEIQSNIRDSLNQEPDFVEE